MPTRLRPERAPAFRRRGHLEEAVSRLARWTTEGADGDAAGRAPQRPTLLICGTPRTGSTLLLQMLSRSGAFRTPSNFHARFFAAPAVGELSWRLLRDPQLDYRGELRIPDEVADPAPFHSDLGKTTGIDAPSEFWYFWRHYLHIGDPPLLGPEGRAAADGAGFRGHLGLWEEVAGRPLAMKALIAAWELPFLAEVLPTAVFVHLRRDRAATIASILGARRQFYGDEGAWYSFRTPDWQELSRLPAQAQVSAQVDQLRAAIDDGLGRVPAARVLQLDHAMLVRQPTDAWSHLAAWLETHGVELPALPGDIVEQMRAGRQRCSRCH